MIHWVQLDPGRTIMPIEPCGPHLTSGSSNYDSRYINRANVDHISKLFYYATATKKKKLKKKKIKKLKIKIKKSKKKKMNIHFILIF